MATYSVLYVYRSRRYALFSAFRFKCYLLLFKTGVMILEEAHPCKYKKATTKAYLQTATPLYKMDNINIWNLKNPLLR